MLFIQFDNVDTVAYPDNMTKEEIKNWYVKYRGITNIEGLELMEVSEDDLMLDELYDCEGTYLKLTKIKEIAGESDKPYFTTKSERNIGMKYLETELLELENLVVEVTRLMRKYIYLPNENKEEKKKLKDEIDKLKEQIMEGTSK